MTKNNLNINNLNINNLIKPIDWVVLFPHSKNFYSSFFKIPQTILKFEIKNLRSPMQRAIYDGSSEIGAYSLLTSSYSIIGTSNSNPLFQTLHDHTHTVETTINSIRTVGSLLIGNRHGLLVPNTILDYELRFLRQNLEVRIMKVDETLNALGNIMVCNDNTAFVNPEVDNETLQIIKDILNVDVHRIDSNVLIGTYAAMNNKGMIVDPSLSTEYFEDILGFNVMKGTVNMGKTSVGSGLIVNDCGGFCGRSTSNPEISVMERVFKFA